MIKVVQFGEGNFLRTFVDVYFDTLNKNNNGNYEVHIVKPIPFGNLDNFKKQDNKYHIVLRGVENGETVENVYKVDCVKNVIDPFANQDEFFSLATDEEVKIIVSNTTEAGICFNEKDKFESFDDITFPAKLTKFLYERFCAGKEGVYLLPVELIDSNADKLKGCVDGYIALWNLPKEFKKWNDENNFYCNTLVDRIVSGYPRADVDKERIEALLGENDALVSIGEPFGLWAVEKKGEIEKYIFDGVHNIEVVLTNDIDYYKKRKVRVLNGSHTNLVPAGLIHGAETVYDCMKDAVLLSFIDSTLKEEIIPFVSNNVTATTAFAESVKQRFLNPFLNHQLTSIALNSISKWRARVLPSFKDYYLEYGIIPQNLTAGFSYLIALYSMVERSDGKFIVQLKNREIELKDDLEYLEYFADNQSIDGFIANKTIWGEDLTRFDGFVQKVIENVDRIKRGETLI